MIKGTIQEEGITVTNIYVPSIRTPQYIRQMLTTIMGEVNSNIIIAERLQYRTHTNGEIIKTEN